MDHIVCLHGLTQGAWCWGKLAPFLRDFGYTVHTPNLVALGGIDLSAIGDAKKTNSLQSAVGTICKLIEGLDGETTIIGHDFSAALAVQATRFLYGKSISIIAISGILPRFGESAWGVLQQLNLNQGEAEYWTTDKCTIMGDSSKLIKYMLHDAALDDVVMARRHNARANYRAMHAALDIADMTLRNLDLAYVCCTKDRIVPISAQRLFIERYQIANVENLECGHAPFFRYPRKLAQSIHNLRLNLRDASTTIKDVV